MTALIHTTGCGDWHISATPEGRRQATHEDGNHYVSAGTDGALYAAIDRIHKAPPSPGRKDFRNKTPIGFARAVAREAAP